MAVINTHTRTIIGEDGSVALPDNLLECAGLKPGDEVIIAIENGHLISHVPSEVSLADELVKERRAEFRRE